ncbi:carboxypeptidase regulatory-like domain-containing protein [Rufibacter radiotolerans]|uniref:carboxypeptidase regulatory-like domain-containing protein n=1 Tax=Rufibacter radiotolerans TaxID=1379910 RepID=UPI0009E47FF4|nr:carboxypeptidase regulatory-like domain-containing protein [Rufibacter radiotolerans]
MPKIVSILRLACLLFLVVSCNEDTIDPIGEGAIIGVVLDAETEKPISAATIKTSPATSSIITDSEGKFVMSAIPDGDYSITAKKTGYSPETVTVAVRDQKQTTVYIQLEPGSSSGSNRAPDPAFNPSPGTDTQNQPISVTLRWQGADPDRRDSALTYDVLLYEAGSTQKKKLAEGISDTSVVANGLMYNTTYFWQVVSKDAQGDSTMGPVWSFKTIDIPDFRFFFARSENGNYDIYSSSGTEAASARLTNAFSREWWPILSPARDKIAYSSNATIEPQIFTMNRDGSGKKQITTLPVIGNHNLGIGFAWSPDGGRLVYANYDKLYTIDHDGFNLTLIATAPAGRHFRMVDWTGQGDKLVVQTIGSNINDSEIYLMDANGANMRVLIGNLPGRVESPTFSIDGNYVLFTNDVDGFEVSTGRQLNSHIFMVKIDGTGLVDLSTSKPNGTNDLMPRFSPDGSKVIFVNTNNDGLGERSIWTLDVANKSTRVKLFSNAEMPDWK